MIDHRAFRTLGELCEVRAETHGDRQAVRDDTAVLTYAELAARARAVARLLGERGVVPGDRVVVQGPNRVAWVSAAFGALLVGATVVPLGHRAPEAERLRLIAQLEPRLVLRDESCAPLAGSVSFAELEALAPVEESSLREWGDPAAPALVLSSSGTSGTVKAVPMTHRQLLRVYDHVRLVLDGTADDVWLATVPLTHSFGFNGILLTAMLAGSTVRLLSHYDPIRLTGLLQEERITVLAGPPTIYHDLAGLESHAPALHTRVGIVGSTEVSARDMARLAQRLGIPRVVTGYGMTETCGTVALGEIPLAPEGPRPWMVPLPGTEVRVCDEGDRAVAALARGRIQVRGHNVCRPYAAAPDLRAGGWFDTGDVGEMDAAGRLSVAGRANDTIIVNGFNVDPREVEEALREHPDVDEAAVVGVRDERTGQRLLACVTARAGVPSSTDLVAHVRARLSPYKVPTHYLVLDELPRTGTGKLSRAALRSMAEEGPVRTCG